MGLPPKPTGQGRERRAWSQPRSAPHAAAAAAIYKRSRSAYPEQTTGTAPASATRMAGVGGYNNASIAVVTETEPAAPASSIKNDGVYVYIRVPQGK